MANTNPGSEGENLSRIKDILFGEDLQGIEQKLDVVKGENASALDKLKEELTNQLKKIETLIAEKTKEVDIEQKKTIDVQKNVTNELKQEITNINIEVKNETAKFEGLFNSTIAEINDKINSLESNLTKAINKLTEDNETKLNEFNKAKISKDTLADLFNELAEKLNK